MAQLGSRSKILYRPWCSYRLCHFVISATTVEKAGHVLFVLARLWHAQEKGVTPTIGPAYVRARAGLCRTLCLHLFRLFLQLGHFRRGVMAGIRAETWQGGLAKLHHLRNSILEVYQETMWELLPARFAATTNGGVAQVSLLRPFELLSRERTAQGLLRGGLQEHRDVRSGRRVWAFGGLLDGEGDEHQTCEANGRQPCTAEPKPSPERGRWSFDFLCRAPLLRHGDKIRVGSRVHGCRCEVRKVDTDVPQMLSPSLL